MSIKPPISRRADAHSYSVEDWQKYFKAIYGSSNARVKLVAFSSNSVSFARGYVIAHISEDLGNLAEQIREGSEKDCKRYIGSLFAWVFALSNEVPISLQEAAWSKYPGECPYCHQAKDCADAWWTSTQMKKGKETPSGDSNLKSRIMPPKNLDGWVETWDGIYGSKIRVAIPLHDVMHKLYEELAEVLEALDGKRDSMLKGVRTELPDFLSWILALIIKLKQYSFLPKSTTLADVLFDKFSQGCYICKRHECKCRAEWLENGKDQNIRP